MLSTDREIQVVGERGQWSEADDIESEADVVITTSASLSAFMPFERAGWTEIPVLYLRDEPLNLQALDSSAAWGLLPQDVSAGELCAAVHALAQGLVVGTRQLLYGSDDARADRGPLTAREAEVLELLAKGLANKQIAVELGISEHTVKFHISSIYTKLNATNRTQAVREGLRNGWILL
jgi:DNA-binding NarL/FixJ family response regulator